MKEYRLYTINYMRDLNTKTDSYDEMMNRVKEIMELVSNDNDSKNFFDGAYIDILENGKLVESMDYYTFGKEMI